MAAQNFDELSIILRANAAKPENGDYRYNMQSALNFQLWLQQVLEEPLGLNAPALSFEGRWGEADISVVASDVPHALSQCVAALAVVVANQTCARVTDAVCGHTILRRHGNGPEASHVDEELFDLDIGQGE